VGDTSEVGSYPTGDSYYEVMDMAGNVWEWVNDWYASDYYTTGGPPWSDPQGPGSGDCRVLRGGGWFFVAGHVRVSYRSGVNPTHSGLVIGFRCARD